MASVRCTSQVLEQAVVIGHTECRMDIPMTTDTSQSFTLDVVATVDNMYDGSHRMVLDVRTYDANQNHWIWQAYALPQVQVRLTSSTSMNVFVSEHSNKH